MRFRRRQSLSRFPRLRCGAALLSAAVLLWISTLAVDAASHRALHDDFDSDAHFCAVSNFSLGVLVPDLPARVPTRDLPSGLRQLPAPAALFLETPSFSLPPERGPPSC